VRDFLEPDLGFATRSFAERDDADFFVMEGVNDVDGRLMKESERDVTFLAVPEPLVFEGERFAVEDSFDIGEIEPMLRKIRLALRFGPAEPDIHCIYTPYIRQIGGRNAHRTRMRVSHTRYVTE
jgi:hypothetical protein